MMSQEFGSFLKSSLIIMADQKVKTVVAWVITVGLNKAAKIQEVDC